MVDVVPPGAGADGCLEEVDVGTGRSVSPTARDWRARVKAFGSRFTIDRKARQVLAAVLLGVAVVSAGAAWFAWPVREPATAAIPVMRSPEVAEAAEITVTVTGDVRSPGLVELPAGSRVADAVAAAGGLVPEVRSAGFLNLGRRVGDGELIVVEGVADDGEEPSGSESPAGGASPGPVNLNQADLAALDALPGIGPVTAQRILDYRAANGGFDSVDELQDVEGIGPATLAKLSGLVTV
ncbi:competence protein ComEA [Stackebrandtia albiflava]|uniref:Competence protein ComEA n=1 Tax=Stackebrandtia albiflava TaxID=406432 RepID=A0A562VG59_9ACTN|nr:ComEA family DNA-binding protein [Stackebrandtia albiflava]TWJ16899.1 competence protein ComEA [Stackebrandtia albiflava]